jgi:hypothetical protein
MMVEFVLTMKLLLFSFLMIGALAIGGAMGCSDREMHLDKLRTAFQSASPETKAQLEMAVADINATNFPDAFTALQRVAFATKMTQDQRKILEDTIRKVRIKISPGK